MSKTIRNSLIAVSLAYIALGLVLILWPEQSKLIICYALGGLTLALGAARIIAYFVKTDLPNQIQFSVAHGILDVIIGLLLIFKANALIALFGVVAGIAIIAESVIQLQIALDVRRCIKTGWLIMFVSSLVMTVLGIILLFDPFGGTTAAAIVIGVTLALDGVVTLVCVLRAYHVLHSMIVEV